MLTAIYPTIHPPLQINQEPGRPLASLKEEDENGPARIEGIDASQGIIILVQGVGGEETGQPQRHCCRRHQQHQ